MCVHEYDDMKMMGMCDMNKVTLDTRTHLLDALAVRGQSRHVAIVKLDVRQHGVIQRNEILGLVRSHNFARMLGDGEIILEPGLGVTALGHGRRKVEVAIRVLQLRFDVEFVPKSVGVAHVLLGGGGAIVAGRHEQRGAGAGLDGRLEPGDCCWAFGQHQGPLAVLSLGHILLAGRDDGHRVGASWGFFHGWREKIQILWRLI